MATCKIVETEAERRGHFAVRHAVFVEEQALFEETDVDEHDDEAIHIVAVDRESGAVVGAVRCYEEGDGLWFGGRLAVLEDYRYNAIPVGPRLVKFAERVVRRRGCRRFLAYIQLQNVRFFERLGWRTVGEPVLHHGQPHQVMEAGFSVAPSAPVPVGTPAHA